MRALIVLVAALAIMLPGYTQARGHSSSSHSASHSTATNTTRSTSVPGMKWNANGKIARSSHSKTDFKHQQPCPSTGLASGSCPGYVIDHVVPLKRGGADAPSNMQWQTTQAAKLKDKVE